MEIRIFSTPAIIERRGEDPLTRIPVCVGHAAAYYDGTPATQFELWAGCVERIRPGTFDRAIAEDDVRALFNHDPSCILGRRLAGTLRLASDPKGLAYEIDLPDTQIGRDLEVSLDRRDVTGSSFSFEATDEEWTKEDGLTVRNITGVKLFDVGPVTFPAYAATDAAVRTASDVDEARQNFDKWRNDEAARARRRGVLVRARLITLGLAGLNIPK